MKRLRLLAVIFGLGAGVALAQSVDQTTPIFGLLQMGNGLHSNDWGTQTNTNIGKIEQAIAGLTSLTLGGGTITLSTGQSSYAIFSLSGTLVSNQTIVFPSVSHQFTVSNNTSGAYSVTIQCGAGSVFSPPQGKSYSLYCDGTNVINGVSPPDALPVGTMMHYAGAAAPANYNLCDGSALSRSTYAALFAAIGTTYGAGNGVTTFNIPNTNGRFLASPDNGSGLLNGWTLAQTGGVSSLVLALNQMPSHTHTLSDPGHKHTLTDPGHTHTANITTIGAAPGGTTASSPGGASAGLVNSNTTGITMANNTTGITMANTGGSTPVPTVPPTLVANCIIRVQ
jgi:microcystin-dependent protein